MSFQLIHTSAAHLLETNASGYGTVARSEKMPKALCSGLSALSVMRDPKGGSAVTGPQFSYNIVEYANTTWHVLTCVQNAGPDYSGRSCHIAHHLVLSQDEVQVLRKHERRPTPAGVILALLKSGFWCARWNGAPQYLTTPPSLTPSDIPDASAQPVWKKLTGHKSNARALFTVPFERDCLVTIAPGTSAVELLHLFHESDWLTHSRGWGITFTTVADEADNFSETLRMVVRPDSPLVQRAIRTGHPVLHIEQGMDISRFQPEVEPPVSSPIAPIEQNEQRGGIVKALSRSVSLYHYTEEPDWLMYDVRPPRSRFLFPAFLAGLGVTGALLAFGCFSISAGDDSDTTAEHTLTTTPAPDNILMLAELLQHTYNHESTILLLNKLSCIQENTPEDTLLLELAMLLQNAAQSGTHHAGALKRVCECARLLGLKDTDVVLLYLREMTHHISPEEWKNQFNGQQIAEWLTLKQQEPQIIDLLNGDEFKEYALTPDEAVTTILAPADEATSESAENQPDIPGPGRVSLIPRTAVSGARIPAELEACIPKFPLSVSSGSFIVSCFSGGGDMQAAQRLDLSEQGFRLYISPTEKAGEFSLKPEHVNGTPSPIPACTFTIRKGRIHSIRCENREAVISFPVPTKEDFHTNIILASSFGIPIPSGKGITLPPAAKARLDITPEALEIIPASLNTKTPEVKVLHKKEFPWVLTKKEKENIRFSIKLPVLTGHNSVRQTGAELSSYKWEQARVTDESDSFTSILCEIERHPTISSKLEQISKKVLNSPCCGEFKTKEPDMTLGNLYYIVCALSNDKISRQEKRELQQRYFKLFANKQFNNVLMRIFAKDTMLHLTPDEATANNFKALKLRDNIKKILDTRGVRDLIRMRISEVLTRSLYAVYTQEQQAYNDKNAPTPVMILDKITVGEHGELVWKFRLQMNK